MWFSSIPPCLDSIPYCPDSMQPVQLECTILMLDGDLCTLPRDCPRLLYSPSSRDLSVGWVSMWLFVGGWVSMWVFVGEWVSMWVFLCIRVCMERNVHFHFHNCLYQVSISSRRDSETQTTFPTMSYWTSSLAHRPTNSLSSGTPPTSTPLPERPNTGPPLNRECLHDNATLAIIDQH